MNIKSRPFKDEEELLPLCYRCSHHNALINAKGNMCANCGQPYIFSFATFVLLPLVEFVLPDDMSDEEALRLMGRMRRMGGMEGVFFITPILLILPISPHVGIIRPRGKPSTKKSLSRRVPLGREL